MITNTSELLLRLQILLIYFPCFWIAKTHHNSTKNEKYTTLTKLKMCKHKYENKILLVKFWWRGTSLCVWEAQIMWWRKILANFHCSSPPHLALQGNRKWIYTYTCSFPNNILILPLHDVGQRKFTNVSVKKIKILAYLLIKQNKECEKHDVAVL